MYEVQCTINLQTKYFIYMIEHIIVSMNYIWLIR